MIDCDWSDDKRNVVRATISGRMTIAHAGELFPVVRDIFSRASRIIFDLNGVEEVDAAGLQLLCSSQQTARAEGKVLQITGLEREPLMTVMKTAGYLHRFTCLTDEDTLFTEE